MEKIQIKNTDKKDYHSEAMLQIKKIDNGVFF